jgi:hypothetical protein
VRFNAERLRKGELIAGGAAIVLLVVMFLIPCFAIPVPSGGHAASLDGWQALRTTRWVLLVTVAVALALVVLTATRRAPAVPVAVAMFACLIGDLASLMLLYRVIHHPGLSARAGIYIGLAAALAVAYGGYRSLRTEGSTFADPGAIETVAVDRARGRSESAPAEPSQSAPAEPSESAPAEPSESAPAEPSESAPAEPSESAPAGAERP